MITPAIAIENSGGGFRQASSQPVSGGDGDDGDIAVAVAGDVNAIASVNMTSGANCCCYHLSIYLASGSFNKSENVACIQTVHVCISIDLCKLVERPCVPK